ncbi:MAG: hypothetical protein WCF84_02160 [Anaerolineae bacterium]
MNSTNGKYLILWDFTGRPLSTFYEVLAELTNGGGLHYVQKSVYIASDADLAQDLVALCRYYGAGTINAVALADGSLDQAADRKAAEGRIADLHVARLHRRGRKPGLKKKGRK